MNIKATYSNGVFRPDEPVSLPEGASVSLDISAHGPDPLKRTEPVDPESTRSTPHEPAWMNQVGILSDEAAEEMEAAIEEAFGKIDHEKW
jgi:predicted DNA-binding antitoxin AbrB/MazE fold protein